MQRLIDAINTGCAQGNWYAALYMSLTMPDICSKLENPDSKESGKRYRMWFDKYLRPMYKSEFHGPDFHFLSAGDCWALRCSLLQEGSGEIAEQKSRQVLSKFQFTTLQIHRCQMEDVLVLNVGMFCGEMTAAVNNWMRDVQADEKIQERMNSMATIESQGFSPTKGVRIEG